MTDPDPKVVPLRQGAAGEAGPARPEAAGRRGRPLVVAALLALLLLFLLAGAGYLRERAARLEAEARAGALLAELERVQASLEAYRLHLGQVRDRVGDLQRELEALAGLVASEPAPPADESPPGHEAGAAPAPEAGPAGGAAAGPPRAP